MKTDKSLEGANKPTRTKRSVKLYHICIKGQSTKYNNKRLPLNVECRNQRVWPFRRRQSCPVEEVQGTRPVSPQPYPFLPRGTIEDISMRSYQDM